MKENKSDRHKGRDGSLRSEENAEGSSSGILFRAAALVAGFARSSKVRISANGTVDMAGAEGRSPLESCFSIKVIGVSLKRVTTPVTMNGIGKITAKLFAKEAGFTRLPATSSDLAAEGPGIALANGHTVLQGHKWIGFL